MLDVRAVNTRRNTCQPVVADTGIICFFHSAPNGRETTKTWITYDRVWKRAHRSLNLSTGLCSGVTQCLAPVVHIAHVRALDFFVRQPGTLLPASCCGQEGFRDLGAVAIDPREEREADVSPTPRRRRQAGEELEGAERRTTGTGRRSGGTGIRDEQSVLQ